MEGRVQREDARLLPGRAAAASAAGAGGRGLQGRFIELLQGMITPLQFARIQAALAPICR
ncbi:MAG: hypothetical protein IPK26_06625 [Planctomycetes bacterium]|nr:hypothetical protein [Planctomycetota bacterium]